MFDVQCSMFAFLLMNDLKFAFRQLLKNPGFTAVAVLTLAIGIGANTAIFSLVNELLLRPLPVKDPERLLGVVLTDRTGDYANQRIPFPIYRDYHEQSRVFSELLAYAPVSAPMQIGDKTRFAPVQLVSANFFSTLGATPVLWRTFSSEDDQTSGQNPVAVISHSCWQTVFNSDPALMGKTVELRPAYVGPLVCTIIGVAPPGFNGLENPAPQIWLPAVMEEHFKRSMGVDFRLVGRLAPGVARGQAAAALDVAAQNIAQKYNGAVIPGYESEGIFRSDLKTQLRPAALGSWGAFRPHGVLRRATALAMGVVGLVLLIACANISNLLLARAMKRRKEIAIRLSLGATRWQIFWQTLIESIVLSLLGAGAGILLGQWGNRVLLALKPNDLELVVQTALDYRVVCFTLFVATLTGLVFGTAPAWQMSRCDVNAALKDETTMVGRDRIFHLRDLLAVGQIAICFVLLMGAGLCLRSLAALRVANPGFNAKDLVVITLELNGQTRELRGPIYQELAQRLESLPGIQSVSFTESFPMLLFGGSASIPVEQIEGYIPQKDEFIVVEFGAIGPKYFETMGIPLVRSPDTGLQGGASLVWINEAFAQRYWPGQDPIGKKVGPFPVSGVVKDSQVKNLWDKPGPYLYLQSTRPRSARLVLMVKTDGNTRAAMPALRQEILKRNKDIELSRMQTMQQVLGQSLVNHRFLLSLLGGFALCATLLAGLGIYGVMSYLVTQRTREIGIRVALGARRGNVVGLVLRRGMLLTVAGIVAGLLGALASTHVLTSVLYQTRASDPLTFGGITLLLIAVASFACWWPARRAAKVDPMQALRTE